MAEEERGEGRDGGARQRGTKGKGRKGSHHKEPLLECGVKKHSESRFWTHREVS